MPRLYPPGFIVTDSCPGIASTVAQDLECSVGVMAYNEEGSIADALTSVLGQDPGAGKLTELIVVASGCTDRTCDIVAGIARQDARVRLIEQENREGKASAINLFISAARSPILVMVSADVVVKAGSLATLLSHFSDPAVGMVGGHPIPVNSESAFLGHAVHLQWRLHDRIARKSPKLGEVVAFRNVVPSIPLDTPVDEISIQALITQLGYRLVYEPQAVVYNRGPETVAEFLRQRRRIYAGHLQVRKRQGYTASTMSPWRVVCALSRSGSFTTPRALLWSLGTVGLEATARLLGVHDVIRRRGQHVWQISGTTKRKIAEGANGRRQYSVAVFHIADFHRHQLEAGLHASRQLTRAVAEQIKRALGDGADVTVQQAGTIIALVPGDREAAERPASEVMRLLRSTPVPLNGNGATTRVTLACGIIAFPPAGPPLARPVQLPAVEHGPAEHGPALHGPALHGPALHGPALQGADWEVKQQ